ncbi:MAG: DNA replication/repair protein RecF [Candidatus Sericytochromatia bacterium]|nr:DNA replication/repair protein RecF [Candidatus Sericytochromatia bacterium]
MFLHHLELTDYRNYQSLHLELSHRKVVLLGDNAQGKTNILEAIGLLATGKSATVSKDQDLVRWGAEHAIIRARIHREVGELGLDMMLRTRGRRACRLNGLAQKRLVDVLGKLLVVLFRAEDLMLVKGGPAERREFIDTILVQVSGAFHQYLQDYQRVMGQRNHLLRAIQEGRGSQDVLEVYDEQFIPLALAIWRRREALISSLVPFVKARHAAIAKDSEQIELRYLPAWSLLGHQENDEEALRQTIQQSRRQEISRGQTLNGPHRDDFELLLDGRPAKFFGSQGQQRTVVLALKLAELDYIKEVTSEAPLLLLDDVLAELDIRRQNALLEAMGEEVQTLVTTTHLSDFSAEWLHSAALFTVCKGQVQSRP